LRTLPGPGAPTRRRILVLNAGSSSLKASVVEAGTALARSSVGWGADASRAGGRAATVRQVIGELSGQAGSPAAVGHRIVHGGAEFVEPAAVDDGVIDRLRRVSRLAPLHNPVAVETLEAARSALPSVPHVVTFDTAFHAALPEHQRRYPVPERWAADWGIRRFGFHGLSVEWATRRAAELLGEPADGLRIVVAHLGSGCSVTAVHGGRSVATSMGMTPLEGLMMGTRAGSIDPGVIVELLRAGRLTPDELADVLDHDSGLLAIGGTADVAELERRASAGEPRALLALEMFAARAAAGIAAAATALERIDAIAFTGGIGENAGRTRTAILQRLGTLGVEAPTTGDLSEDAVVSRPGARIAVLRIESREDLVIAGHVERSLATT